MNAQLLPIALGFLEGFALIISPCILPILPIFLAGSLTGSKKRPLGIIIGFAFIFALFAYFSRKLVQYSGIDLNTIRYISFVILSLLGIIMISSYLSEKFSKITQGIVSFSPKNHSAHDFINGFFLGGMVAIIWTPCAGPILASIIVQTVMEKTNIISFFTLFSFALGAAIPMLIIAFCGRNLANTFYYFQKHATAFRKILGIIILASVSYMIYQESHFATTGTVQSSIKTSNSLQGSLWFPYTSPEIVDIDSWINSPPLSLHSLKGKVVLVDFWTYSCINCMRTIPYLNNWYQKYHDKGLIIIGVHTPEFDFEKKLANVTDAVKRDEILYPVALDNHFSTWENFANHYWPAHYLIDKNGQVVYKHFGEGDYDVTENNIRFLLGINQTAIPTAANNSSYFTEITPETYLGYGRADNDFSPILIPNQPTNYKFSNSLAQNAWSLQGLWNVYSDKIVSAEANAAVSLHFKARKIYIVMGNNTSNPITVNLLLNGKSLSDEKGKDVIQSSIAVKNYKLYELVILKETDDGILQITASKPGLEIYTFTFGN